MTDALATGECTAIDEALIADRGDGSAGLEVLVPQMHCAGCIARIERAVRALPGVLAARANLTSRRVSVSFDPKRLDAPAIVRAIETLGFTARPFDAAALADGAGEDTGAQLVRAMAVAGFAAANVMLLSVSVWSGAEAATRELFHWLSALIALPAIAYAGRPFFGSAARALSRRRLNMDVPISLAVLLAAAMSLYETALGDGHVWFDASIGLLFFLLVGRFLDHRMRRRAHESAARLLSLAAQSARVIADDGTATVTAVANIRPGARVQVAAGERIPLDGTIADGASDVDTSMLTGEPLPAAVAAGDRVFAGALNLTGPLAVTVTAAAEDCLLADIVRLMERAERPDGRFVGLADAAARIYAPAVHLLALATFLGWLALGAGVHDAVSAAVAVLIITCPCALALAVPAVQVVVAGRLLRCGIILKDGAALEKLAAVDTVVFDKTGTLTRGRPRLTGATGADATAWALAAALAAGSRHPLATALGEAAAAQDARPVDLADVREHPGCGMSASLAGTPVRLGRAGWITGADAEADNDRPSLWLDYGGAAPARFVFEDNLRPDAAATVATLAEAGYDTALLSGDREGPVAAVASRLGIERHLAAQSPTAKAAVLERLAAGGRRTLMVGDGINDAPALRLATVSMSPSSAADISQNAADLVFTGERLAPVAEVLALARRARRVMIGNFALALAYNAVAVPLAVAGYATPLIAAIAMSSSSILVTANALRLGLAKDRQDAAPARLAPSATFPVLP